MKPPKFLFRYIIEAVLIFGSVYGAFLLEDYRAKSEQHQVFAKRWIGLINSIASDSLKLTALLHNSGEVGVFPTMSVYGGVEHDSALLANYEYLISKEDAQTIIESLKSFRYWAMSYTEQEPYYQDIIENHPDLYLEICLENPQVCEWLDIYFQYHRRIDRYNRHTREIHIRFWDELSNSYPIPGTANFSDSLALAKDFRSRNYLFNRHRHNKSFTLPSIESMIQLNNKLYPVLLEVDLN